MDVIKKGSINLSNIDMKTHKIMSMEKDKRQRLINSALEEFSKGYSKANTDTIVKNCDISKGLLYHYFGTKKNLFFFLLKYSLVIITEEFQRESYDSPDILENVWKLSLVSAGLTIKHPLIYGFMVPAYLTLDKEFPGEPLTGFVNPIDGILANCYKNIDKSIFRNDVNIPKACNVIMWTMKGYSDSLQSYGESLEDYEQHYEEIKKELLEYMALLRKILYK